MANILKLTDGIAVENDSLRITFPLADGLIGRYLLYARTDDQFPLAAVVDPISEISYRTQDGATVTERIAAAGYEMDRRGPDCILRLDSEFHDADGVRWSVNIEFCVPDRGPRLSVVGRLSTSRPRHLLAFRGPFLRVPAGQRNPKRSAALFPGLDWVVADESSSSPETAPPPFDRRSVPHPYKITVPVMAVAHSGLVTGLTWDPLQIWDGERVEAAANRYPSAVFASPDSVGGTQSHLMGLFVPSVPKFVDENALWAVRPFEMTPGREVRLECTLFVLRSADVVNAVNEYVHLCGLIPPPPKPRDYRENLDLDIATYLDRAWSRSHAAWARSSSAEEKWTFYSEPVALALWSGSLLTHDDALRRRIRDCVETAISARGGLGGVSMGYFRGGLERELDVARGQLDKLVQVQQADGGWSAGEDATGRRREKSLMGVTAEHAARLLRSALLTGDPKHLEAGIHAVRFLDNFDRPCGLRPLEIHESAPDLLAASHLLSAYLDLYLLTGAPARLDRAAYWAWAGLPFVYLWHAHNRDIMRYAAVPFFGVTAMDRRPWFGVAAQWTGLAYAEHLFHLSRYDRSTHWHRIARAITLCAMQLQKTARDGQPALVGFYPDAFNVLDGRDYYPLCLNPQWITQNVLRLLGEEPEPRCEVVPWRERRVRIATVARMLAIRSTPQRLTVRMVYPVGENCHLTLADCERPREILQGEKKLPELDDLAQVRRGWKRDDSRGLTIVRVEFAEPEEILEFRF